jgi:hypothetical protein
MVMVEASVAAKNAAAKECGWRMRLVSSSVFKLCGGWPDYVGRHMLQNARWMWLVVLERMGGQRNLHVLSHIGRRRKIRHSPGSKNFPNAGKVS